MFGFSRDVFDVTGLLIQDFNKFITGRSGTCVHDVVVQLVGS